MSERSGYERAERRCQSGRVVRGDTEVQSEVLEDLRGAARYRRWLADLAVPYLGARPIEVGSGNGDLAAEWAPGVQEFTATEADDGRFARLAERFAGHPVIRTEQLQLPANSDRDHSSAVAFNVLEHVDDDVGALRSMARMARRGAPIVVLVPAFPSALGKFDRAIGHVRRYRKDSLRDAFVGAGLGVDELRYVNPLGLVNWYVAVKLLGLTPRDGVLLRAYDRAIVPVARAMDKGLGAPFGQSVFAVGSTASD